MNKEFFERLRKKREEQLLKRTDYEKAVSKLKANAGYCETKERIMDFLEEATVKEPEKMLTRLINEGKIIYDSKACKFPYILTFITVDTKEENEETE